MESFEDRRALLDGIHLEDTAQQREDACGLLFSL